MYTMTINIREPNETAIGIANMMHDTSNMDNPSTITGFRPTLSDKDPVIGEKTMYTTLLSKNNKGIKNSIPGIIKKSLDLI